MPDHRAPASTGVPPKYKVALLTWVGVYPVITAILAIVGPATASWPLPLRTLLLSGLMVPVLTWLVIPALTRVLNGWLRTNTQKENSA
jgi:antibiotic biosynthesis monooxygenase (ABM) superfamily enzyme